MHYLLIILILVVACSKSPQLVDNPDNTDPAGQPPPPPTIPPPQAATFDLNTNPLPQFVQHHYIAPDKMSRVSLLRSGAGHDYSDDFESCRSMKHYFQPKGSDWTSITVYSPVNGKVVRIMEEWAGTQVHIESTLQPAFTFIIFHVKLSQPLTVGDTLEAGALLGNHISSQTSSDIAVAVRTPVDGPKDREAGSRLISLFEVLTENAFADFQAVGIPTRESMIITAAERDAHPLTCNGETFSETGTLPDWKDLE